MIAELSELAGYTARVSLLLDTITDVRDGVFHKTSISDLPSEQCKLLPICYHFLINGFGYIVRFNRGLVIESDDIQFENVPIITPTGDVLVRSLSFHIKSGV